MLWVRSHWLCVPLINSRETFRVSFLSLSGNTKFQTFLRERNISYLFINFSFPPQCPFRGSIVRQCMLHQNKLYCSSKLTERVKSTCERSFRETQDGFEGATESSNCERMAVNRTESGLRDTKEAITQKEWYEITSRVYP